MSEILATLIPSKMRRIFASGLLAILGLSLLYLFANQPPTSLPLQIIQVVTGIGLLLQARRLWYATANGVLLREDGIYDLNGVQICAMDNIKDIDRGFLAFKPSNGFLVRLHQPLPRAWAPGMWWRLGRRLGIGGTISAADSKHMADVLAVYLQSKNQTGYHPR